MKRFLSTIIGILCLSPIAFSQDYYWHHGEKIALQQGNQRYIIFDDDLLIASDKSQIIESGDVFYSDASSLKWGITEPDAVIEDEEHVLYSIPSFVAGEDNFFITHRFYVKLKNENDVSVLMDIARQYNAGIEENDNLDLWYVLRCGLPSQYTALELANIFLESGLFAAAEPEFMGAVRLDNDAENIQSTIDHSSMKNKYLHKGIFTIEYRGKKYNAQGVEIR